MNKTKLTEQLAKILWESFSAATPFYEWRHVKKYKEVYNFYLNVAEQIQKEYYKALSHDQKKGKNE